MAKNNSDRKRYSVWLLISWLIGLAYLVYAIITTTGVVAQQTTQAGLLGASIGMSLIAPHLAAMALAVVFTIIGWMTNIKGLALTGAILYALAIVFFPAYFLFVIAEMALAFIGFARMKSVKS